MQLPGAGIVRANSPAAQHSEYPKHMRHPAFQPGVADQEIKVINPETGKPTGGLAYVGGRAIRLPPVLAMDADQEEYHKSQGYVVVGKSDPAAFARAVRAAAPQAETHDPAQYPKWIAALGRSVDSAEQEAELLGLSPPASSEEPSAEPAVSAEVKTLLDCPDLASADAARIDALEAKVGTILSGFDRLEAMLGRIAGTQAMSAAPEPPKPPATPAARRRTAPGRPTPQRSAESIARGEKIKAGIAKRKAAEEAAKATENMEYEAGAPSEMVVADEGYAVE